MRPTAEQALRGIQATVAEMLLPELRTVYAQDAAQVVQMLLESVASEVDTAAEDLVRDNETVAGLLREAREGVPAAAASNAALASLVKEIDGALAQAGRGSLALSVLQGRNAELNGLLERLLAELEDLAGEAAPEPLMRLRRRIYQHLRDLSLRGWSVWDMMSFRERMARARAGA